MVTECLDSYKNRHSYNLWNASLGIKSLSIVFSTCQFAPFHCWAEIYFVNCMHK